MLQEHFGQFPSLRNPKHQLLNKNNTILDNRFPRTSIAGTICQKHQLLNKNNTHLDNRFPRTSVAGTICQKHKLLEKHIQHFEQFPSLRDRKHQVFQPAGPKHQVLDKNINILDNFQACGTKNVKFSTSGTKNIKFFNQRGQKHQVLDKKH